jgi:ubiquinone/menaquinone biosynthesis C-methylase UbiE
MDYNYPGDELNLFKEAQTWKKYWYSNIKKYVSGRVLEVGCGNGANTEMILEKIIFD